MKTLLILRHGKSSWADSGLADHDRPLKKRGRRGARSIGAQLRERGLVPDLVLSSTARRARDTARGCLEECGAEAPIELNRELYATGVERHLEAIAARAGDAHGTVLVVGHNPDLEGLVRQLSGEHTTLKTAFLAAVALDIDRWSELPTAQGRLRALLRP